MILASFFGNPKYPSTEQRSPNPSDSWMLIAFVCLFASSLILPCVYYSCLRVSSHRIRNPGDQEANVERGSMMPPPAYGPSR